MLSGYQLPLTQFCCWQSPEEHVVGVLVDEEAALSGVPKLYNVR